MMVNNMEHWKNKSLINLTEQIGDICYTEEWKKITGYEGLYEVSSLGRIKSIKRIVPHKTSYTKTIPERILCISKDSQGYLLANLYKNNKCFHGLIHRLVAKEFVPNLENLPEVNHEKGNKQDNRYWELNWCTASQNQIHSFEVLKRKSFCPSGINNPRSKKVFCVTLGLAFDSSSIASKMLGVCQSAISFVCCNKRLHTEGLVFKYI